LKLCFRGRIAAIGRGVQGVAKAKASSQSWL
jgi:hypothetical protein